MGAASSIKMNRNLSKKGFSAALKAFMTRNTASLVNHALLRQRTNLLSVRPFIKSGVIHACMICSAPTIIWGSSFVTASQSLTNATKVTAARLSFNGFRRSIRKDCRRFHPGCRATCPCLCCGDNLTLDSSILICTTVLFPMPSDSRKLFHLQVASACMIGTTHTQPKPHVRKRQSEKKARKTVPLFNGS